MSAAFLPFLKKQPASALKPALQQQEDEDPLAVQLPPPQPSSKLSTTTSKFVSKVNGRSLSAKPPDSHAGGRSSTAPKGSNIPKPGVVAAPSVQQGKPSRSVTGKSVARSNGKGPTAGGSVPLSPAAAKAEVERRRLKQLERLAALGSLASKDTPPEVLAKYEQAKQQAAEIKKQHEQAAKIKLQEEQRRQRLEAQRQKLQQERVRIAEEKQRHRLAVASGAGSTRLATPPRGTAGGGSGAAGALNRPAAAGARGPGAAAQSSAAGLRQPGPRSSGQQQDPYAHLNPKQRAFLLARKQEREGRKSGRMGSSERRRGSSADGYGSDPDGYSNDEYDDLDDFIDNDDDIDWRSQLRATTGYDPRRYQDSFWDDRKMEASAAEIAAEERRSAKLGKAEDEKEAEAEARRTAAKEAKRSRKRGAAALFDD